MGNVFLKGVSGGQKRRTSIGMELVVYRKIMFLGRWRIRRDYPPSLPASSSPTRPSIVVGYTVASVEGVAGRQRWSAAKLCSFFETLRPRLSAGGDNNEEKHSYRGI